MNRLLILAYSSSNLSSCMLAGLFQTFSFQIHCMTGVYLHITISFPSSLIMILMKSRLLQIIAGSRWMSSRSRFIKLCFRGFKQEFAAWLLSVGDGRDYERAGGVEHSIKLPQHMHITGTPEQRLENLIAASYPDTVTQKTGSHLGIFCLQGQLWLNKQS